jgi:hypothetical protein
VVHLADSILDTIQVSITFDPFMYLTLPLPQTAQFKTTIQYIPYDPQASPVKVGAFIPIAIATVIYKWPWLGELGENG